MTKDWIGFLSAAFRLVDLHDTTRSFGVAPGTVKEARTGRGDGLWLHLAVPLLAYLDECDLESNEGWNPIGPFQKEVIAGPEGLREEDVQQFVSYLATPTEVYFLKEDRLVSTKDTALIERRSMRAQADLCRLTQRCRLALGLARLSHNWLYAHHDAGKLMSAIQYGEFQDLPRQCSSLGQSVRAFSHEITRVMEQPGKSEQVEHFLQRGNQYLDSIQKVQGAVRNAREMLGTAEVRDRFEQWLEARGEWDLSLGLLRRSLDELMQSVERLSRRFSAFLHQVTETRREVVGNIPFEQAALAFVFKPPDAHTLDTLAGNLGAWLPALAFGAPQDMQGLLRAEVDSHQALQARVFGEDADAERECTLMELFVMERREEILAALAAGPLRLGEAVERGWARLDGQPRLSELVGVYGAPSWLGPDAEGIRLILKPGALEARLEGRSWLAGDDIEMCLEPKAGVPDGPR